MYDNEFRVEALVGPNNAISEERRIMARTFYDAARLFAGEHGETVYPGRWEQPTNSGGVYSFGWTNHGLRIWVYEQ